MCLNTYVALSVTRGIRTKLTSSPAKFTNVSCVEQTPRQDIDPNNTETVSCKISHDNLVISRAVINKMQFGVLLLM